MSGTYLVLTTHLIEWPSRLKCFLFYFLFGGGRRGGKKENALSKHDKDPMVSKRILASRRKLPCSTSLRGVGGMLSSD